ncbi:MAG: glycosyltransferase [Acidimicrobiales bacterium]
MTLPEPTPRLTSPIAARAPGAFSTSHADDFDAARLAQRKGSLTVSLCLPAHDEAETIGDIVRSIRRNLMHDVPLVDEMIVIDDASTDRTAEIATAAGATVLDSAQVLVEQGSRRGKGEALWKSVDWLESRQFMPNRALARRSLPIEAQRTDGKNTRDATATNRITRALAGSRRRARRA